MSTCEQVLITDHVDRLWNEFQPLLEQGRLVGNSTEKDVVMTPYK
jgi:hypothetical protein